MRRKSLRMSRPRCANLARGCPLTIESTRPVLDRTLSALNRFENVKKIDPALFPIVCNGAASGLLHGGHPQAAEHESA